MSWASLIGHEEVIQRFKAAAAKGRLVSTYLFVGPHGIGKRKFAQLLAQAVLCSNANESELNPCGTCTACQQVIASTHPDLIQISKPKDKAYIPVETFIGDREHRMQVGLCHDISLKPFSGSRKIAIVDDADLMNVESANALLKTLEEPPQGSIIILLSSSQHRQLSTIVSRSQVIRFEPLTTSEVLTILESNQDIESSRPLNELAAASGGSIQTALELADEAVFEFRTQLLEHLASLDPGAMQFTKQTTEFIDGAGKESAAKRQRAIRVGDFAIEFYRNLMVSLSGQPVTCDEEMVGAVNRASQSWRTSIESAGKAIHRTMDFQNHIARNANTANAVQCWYSDLGKINRGELITVN